MSDSSSSRPDPDHQAEHAHGEKPPGHLRQASFGHRLTWTLVDATKRFFLLQGLSQAAALGFFVLLSLVPLIMLMLILAGFFWGNSDQVQGFISEQLEEVIPWAMKTLETALHDPGGHIAGLGWMSLIFIFWTAGQFFSQLQTSLILPWTHRKVYRNKWWRYVIPWTIGPALAIASGGVLLVMNVAPYLPTEWLPPGLKPKLMSFIISTLLILLVYVVLLPARSVSIRAIFCLSAILSGAELALSTIFAAIIVNNPQYTLVYGSLAALILFLIWVYYSMSILVFGGYFLESWAFVHGRRHRPARRKGKLDDQTKSKDQPEPAETPEALSEPESFGQQTDR